MCGHLPQCGRNPSWASSIHSSRQRHYIFSCPVWLISIAWPVLNFASKIKTAGSYPPSHAFFSRIHHLPFLVLPYFLIETASWANRRLYRQCCTRFPRELSPVYSHDWSAGGSSPSIPTVWKPLTLSVSLEGSTTARLDSLKLVSDYPPSCSASNQQVLFGTDRKSGTRVSW